MLELKTEIRKKSLEHLLTQIRQGPQKIHVACTGGDFLGAMEFVDTIRREGLEGNISFEILFAKSAAAYILLSLNCKKELLPEGRVHAHGGDIRGELNSIIIGQIYPKMVRFFEEMAALVRPLVSPSRWDRYTTHNRLRLTQDECRRAGITILETSGSPQT